MRSRLACFPSSRLRTPRQSHRYFQTRNTRTNRHWIPGHSERLAILFVLSCSQEGQRPLAGGIGCFGDTTIPVLPTRRPALFPMLIVFQRISCQHHCHHPCLSQLRFFPTNSILCLNCIIDLSLVTSTLRSSHYSHLVFITRRNGTLLVSLHKWLTGTFRGIESFSDIEEFWSNQSTCLSDIIHCSFFCHIVVTNPSPKSYLLHQFMYQFKVYNHVSGWVYYALPRLYLWIFDTFVSSQSLWEVLSQGISDSSISTNESEADKKCRRTWPFFTPSREDTRTQRDWLRCRWKSQRVTYLTVSVDSWWQLTVN